VKARTVSSGPFQATRDSDGGWIIMAYQAGGALQFNGSLLRPRDIDPLRELLDKMQRRGLCEGCDRKATTSDAEGVPLCRACYRDLVREARAAAGRVP
jgi:hypothetical protein